MVRDELSVLSAFLAVLKRQAAVLQLGDAVVLGPELTRHPLAWTPSGQNAPRLLLATRIHPGSAPRILRKHSPSSCVKRAGCSKAAKWSPFFSSLSPLRRF